ncbi:protein of unknown function [Candidatus Promineifilum breve]|uniref:Uncharacterized protein n=1 Tax=Candidatus Promineifilum breve TaxID=1806508 RepID=A0A160T0M6_9CHLR|nr:protein of unknown function [Candidatus Promineifilum breve]
MAGSGGKVRAGEQGGGGAGEQGRKGLGEEGSSPLSLWERVRERVWGKRVLVSSPSGRGLERGSGGRGF